jgi:hypothetical protein
LSSSQADAVNIRCLPAKSSSSDSSDLSDAKSCFDTNVEGETDSDTNPIDVDTNIEGEEKDGLDILWIISEDKDHSLEYYLNQEKEIDKAKDTNEDYKNSSSVLLDRIEER